MDKKNLLKYIVVLMFLMFLANSLAIKFHWYYSIWYFDMVMHFSGGFWVALFFLYVFFTNEIVFKEIFKVTLCVMLVGVLWEFFEFFSNNYIAQDPFDIIDTLSDIFFDLFGGLCAILYLWKKQQIKQPE